MSLFKKAVRSQRKLKAAIDGPSGAGKTFSTLRLAFSLKAAGMCQKIAVIDTENNSASLYAGETPDGEPWEFDVLGLTDFSPDKFTNAINAAVKEGYDCIVIDSLSHAWTGAGGALDLVDKKGGNKYTAWKDVTPLHRKMVDAIIQAPVHILVTMRSKTEYVLEPDANGKQVPRKIGVAPIQRDGMEYEFDVYLSADWSHHVKTTKTRCRLMDGAEAVKPGPQFWAPLLEWLQSAAPSPPPPPPEPAKHTEGPNNSPESFRDNFLAGMSQAATVEEMNEIGAGIKAAAKAGWITPPIVSELRGPFQSRLAEIKATPAEVKS